MKNGNEQNAKYPNSERFQQLAIDNAQTEYQLKQLEQHYKAARIACNTRLAELEQHRADLAVLTQYATRSDFEEAKRRENINELMNKINVFEKPEPVNEEMYRIQKSMLEHKLKETAHHNAALLIWQAKKDMN